MPIKPLLQLLLRGGSNHFIAEGTPFEKPKIGNSIVDLVGGTPMVSGCFVYAQFVLNVT